MCAQEHESKLVVGNYIDELVEFLVVGMILRVHVVGLESMSSEMALTAG